MKKSLLFVFAIFFFNQFIFARDTTEVKKIELTKAQLIARIDSARVLAIIMLQNTPDTLGIKDGLLCYLTNVKIHVATISKESVMIQAYGTRRAQRYDILVSTTQEINYLRDGVFTDTILACAYYLPMYGVFVNSTWVKLQNPQISLEEIASAIIHEYVHFAQTHRIGKTTVDSASLKDREIQAWWFAGFVHASNHLEIFTKPVSCGSLDIAVFFSSNDLNFENNMRWALFCPKTFLEFLGY